MRILLIVYLLLPFFGMAQIYESNYTRDWQDSIISGLAWDKSTREMDSLIIIIDYKEQTVITHAVKNEQISHESLTIAWDIYTGYEITFGLKNVLDSTIYFGINENRTAIYYYQYTANKNTIVKELNGPGVKIIEKNVLYKGYWDEATENQDSYLLDLNLLNGNWRMDISDTLIWTYQIDTIYSNEIDLYKSAAHGHKFYNYNLNNRGQFFYITIASESQVKITDRDSCFAYEYWIRKLTADELILFDGSETIWFERE